MNQQPDWGRCIRAPTQEATVTRDTGLSPHQQRERATIARLWAWRITWLQRVTGCTVRDALRAAEDAERSTAQ